MSKFLSLALLLLLLQISFGSAFAHSKDNEYHFTVKSGDSLSKYFSKLGLSKRLLASLLSASKQNQQLNQLNIGEKITIRLHANRRFKSLNHQPHNKAAFGVVLLGSRFANSSKQAQKKSKPLSTIIVTINNSFGYDAQKSGLNLNTINTVVKALSWQLDFSSDLHKGDRFFIVSDGSEKPVGIIYKGSNKRIEVFSHTDDRNRSRYYDRYGYTLNSSFLRAPLKYKRISSKFQLKRYHPILKTYRPHRAVDYAAVSGTPVYSTADGIVKLKGWKGALGKVIIIKHGANYTTVYAHLSKYASNLRKGKAVKKGQIIGYVGSTGRSTGAHLHYELRYKGKRKDPLSYKLPTQKKISHTELWRFRSQVNKVLASL
ncbi:Peptidase, M23/M37 family [Bathymodiolus heckerae thiotrophic gill symbiont]|uniref:peptidoglycan DD-metalloendopeptidase family protein n=1 Tax=Bathymodiolus heckerae thiotrophic gill symbiont TaxID=1052212 RepID=UPI0010B86B5D|nr:peptidoglycan DD-metalloendopeptidase family protein [Bathymodiolus heckerae thiotrophic gill symbiont]SHN91554.1 Peptidase, M23/M37 family [Bathymodiolus heckerae thiotrophic gill symbiont]